MIPYKMVGGGEMVRFLSLLLVALALSGCDLIRTGLTSRAQKVNTAFPVSEELVVSQLALFNSIEGTSHKGLREQYAELLELRALNCSGGADLSRLDTPADIKTKIADSACFREQDAKLMDWLGTRRVILALQKPALVPLSALPPRTLVANPGDSMIGLIVAANANVAVLKGNRSVTAVELPSSKAINSFSVPEAYRQSTLSSNGRVLTVPFGNESLKFMDIENGSTLWNTTKYADVAGWMPSIEATLLLQRGNAAPFLLDHRTARVEPYRIPLSRLTWAVPLPEAGRLVMGDPNNVLLVDHIRDADGTIKVNTPKQWRLAGSGVTSSTPLIMANGKKVVYVTGRDLGWLDLENGAQGTWAVSALNASGFSKVSESSIYMDTALGQLQRRPRLLNIDQAAFYAVRDADPNEGLLVPLNTRAGYARRGPSATIIGGTAVAEGEPESVEKVLAEASLAQQLAKLGAEFAPSPEQASAAASAAAAAAAAAQAVAGRVAPARSFERTLIPGVPPTAHVSVIGLYEPADPSRRGASSFRTAKPVDVVVAASSTPLVLVLSSYEPVQWRINSNKRPIAAVLLSGYHQSTVTGFQGSVINIGQQSAYKMDSAEYLALKQAVARYVVGPVRLFQGSYSGSVFSVPAN
jgi:hypothetical protein